MSRISRSRRELFNAAALGLAGAQAAPAQGPWSPKKQSASGPIRSGHLLFLSGIGGWYPERRPKAGDVKQQTSDALVDPEKNWDGMNEVYDKFFRNPKPARSYFGASGFRRAGQLLQIDCIAYVD